MKKILLSVALALVLGACSEISSFMGSSSSGTDTGYRAKLHSCMLNDATTRFQAGTLFNDSITATAKDIAGGCIKKLALESMGISSQAQSDAENIITCLRNIGSAN